MGYKGNTATEQGVIFCPYKKEFFLVKLFKRLFKKISRIFRRKREYTLYVMELGKPTKDSRRVYREDIVCRELSKFNDRRPLYVNFGPNLKLDRAVGQMFHSPATAVPECDPKYIAGTARDFTLKDHALYVKVKFMDTDLGERAEKMVRYYGENNLRCSPVGEGTVTNGVVNDDYKLITLDLTAR